MSSSEIFSEILKNIQTSPLNFNINLTPFSAYITLRNSFNKSFTPSTKLTLSNVSVISEELTSENFKLKEEKVLLIEQVENLIAANGAF